MWETNSTQATSAVGAIDGFGSEDLLEENDYVGYYW